MSAIETDLIGDNTYGTAGSETSTEKVYRATVFGPAGTQGSKRMGFNKKTGRNFSIEDSDGGHHTWRQDMIREMLNDRPDDPFDCAVKITMWVFVSRPKGHYNSRHELKPTAPVLPPSGRDLDKTMRAVGDATKHAGWVKDDARIAWGEQRRFYCELGEPERTVVMMEWQGMTIGSKQKEALKKIVDNGPLFEYATSEA